MWWEFIVPNTAPGFYPAVSRLTNYQNREHQAHTGTGWSLEGKQQNRQCFHSNMLQLLHSSLWERWKLVGRSLVPLLPQEPESLWCQWPVSLPCVLYFPTLVVPLNITFTPTLNVTQSIYLCQLFSISLLLIYWEAPLIVLTSYFLYSTMLWLFIFPLQHKIYHDVHTLWIHQNFYHFQ